MTETTKQRLATGKARVILWVPLNFSGPHSAGSRRPPTLHSLSQKRPLDAQCRRCSPQSTGHESHEWLESSWTHI